MKKANAFSSDSEILFFILFHIDILTPTNSNGRFVIQQCYLTKMNKIKYKFFKLFGANNNVRYTETIMCKFVAFSIGIDLCHEKASFFKTYFNTCLPQELTEELIVRAYTYT